MTKVLIETIRCIFKYLSGPDGSSATARWVFRPEFGGAEGIRTLDLLDAIEARSQLRHGPTGLDSGFYSIECGGASNKAVEAVPDSGLGKLSSFSLRLGRMAPSGLTPLASARTIGPKLGEC